MTLPRQLQAQQTMLANMPKRPKADPWTLETTTAPQPGAGSIAEGTMDYAKAVIAGLIPDPSLFFFHREASDKHDLTTREGRRAAVIEASGPAAVWRDVDRIAARWDDPTADQRFLERVWLNRMVQSSTQAFDAVRWSQLARTRAVSPKALVALGFDGSIFHDATALVATELQSGYQWLEGLWERPLDWRPERPWQVPSADVDRAVREAFQKYEVMRLYADPRYWESWIATWVGLFGKERVHEWPTNQTRRMAAALVAFDTAIREGTLAHSGDPAVARHIGNARRRDTHERDEQGKAFWVIEKERPDSPHKIDAAMASVLSWEARNDSIAAGALKEPQFQMFFAGGRR
jgi:phage terminase large subunit-like protein